VRVAPALAALAVIGSGACGGEGGPSDAEAAAGVCETLVDWTDHVAASTPPKPGWWRAAIARR
jgi:hypothetical protein